jgi:hypothetical protein
MSGGPKGAKRPLGRPLDGRVGAIDPREVCCELCKRLWEVRKVECFDETLGRADLASSSGSEKPMQLLVCRRMAVLGHGLEASKRAELSLFLLLKAEREMHGVAILILKQRVGSELLAAALSCPRFSHTYERTRDALPPVLRSDEDAF